MRLDRAILIKAKAPMYFLDKLEFCGNCELTKQEIDCFYAALLLMQDAIERDGLIIKYRSVAYFTDSDRLIIDVSNDPDILGWYGQVICYHVYRWRRVPRSDLFIMTIMLEELCHCFYQSHSEDFVKSKTTEILRTKWPQLTREILYKDFHDPGAAALPPQR